MKTLLYNFALIGFFLLLAGCDGEEPLLKIGKEEQNWIPYTKNQEIQFENDKKEVVTLKTSIQNSEISRSGKTLSSAYKQEQIALYLYTIAPHRNSLSFAIRPSTILIGASIDDAGTRAQAIIKKEISGYKIEEDKFNLYSYLPELRLNGIKYKEVFHRRLEKDFSGNNYFPEYYYAKGQVLIAFKIDNQADWFYLKN